MNNIDFKLIGAVMLFVILISIQLTLNKILMILREIKRDIREPYKTGFKKNVTEKENDIWIEEKRVSDKKQKENNG